MKLFENYINNISDIFDKKSQNKFLSFSGDNEAENYIEKSHDNEKVLMSVDTNQLTTLFGKNAYSFNKISIGTHPDFSNIQYSKYENHYCVTMFMDIKGSTRLIEKYSLLQVRKIKDTVLTLAIHIASHFGGHIHRLQGDGILIQFVRKGQCEEDAVINSFNASSIISQFISTELADFFKSNGDTPLRVRIGVDIGYNKDVIWSHYGIPDCSELTTTSLHTDLAAKLQAQAPSNGILIGENIKEILDLKAEFCNSIIDNEGNIDYYIYKGIKYYKKYNFNWTNYLKSFDFIKKSSNSTALNIIIPEIRIKCFISDENGDNRTEYFQNSCRIKKGYKIEYYLMENGHTYFKKEWEQIEWTAFNSGKEALEMNELKHDFKGEYKNKVFCYTNAGYKGHHHVQCLIIKQHSDNLKICFPIFVA